MSRGGGMPDALLDDLLRCLVLHGALPASLLHTPPERRYPPLLGVVSILVHHAVPIIPCAPGEHQARDYHQEVPDGG